MAARFRDGRRSFEAFRLGDEWPDWWADAVSANVAVTHNTDGRMYGGPDYADIKTREGTVRIRRGDWIIRDDQGEIFALSSMAATTLSDADGLGYALVRLDRKR